MWHTLLARLLYHTVSYYTIPLPTHLISLPYRGFEIRFLSSFDCFFFLFSFFSTSPLSKLDVLCIVFVRLMGSGVIW